MPYYVRSCGFPQTLKFQVLQFPNLINVVIKLYCYWEKSVSYSPSESRAFTIEICRMSKNFLLLQYVVLTAIQKKRFIFLVRPTAPQYDNLILSLNSLAIYDALCDSVPFVQFKNREKHPWRSVYFSKVLKVTLLHGCFSCFLNCANGTKSCNASHVGQSCNMVSQIVALM